MEQTVMLSLAPVGVRLRLAETTGEIGDRPEGDVGRGDRAAQNPPGMSPRRLAQLGLRPGVDLVVVHRTAGRGRVVAVAGSRIALDEATASRLRAVVAEEPHTAASSASTVRAPSTSRFRFGGLTRLAG